MWTFYLSYWILQMLLLISENYQQLQVNPPHLVVLWVEQFGKLVKDEAGVGDWASEGVVDRCVEMVGSQYSISCCKPRPHHQHWIWWLVKLAAGDGCLQLPERMADVGQGLALHAEPGWNVVGSRRQHHVVGQQGERYFLWHSRAI